MLEGVSQLTFPMAIQNDIITEASAHVAALFNQKLPVWALYHTYDHTTEVVDACKEIGEASKLGKPEMEIVILAAWFHDTGYTELADGHEGQSVDIATRFLQQKGYAEEKISQVAGCIRATTVPQQPTNLLEEIVCDADLSHLGKKKFFEKSDLLRAEVELRLGKSFSDVEWLSKGLNFVARSTFHTEYAQAEFANRRSKNLVVLQEQLRDALSRDDAGSSKQKAKEEKAAAKAEKEKRPERGIETMFRVIPKNHLDLSGLADHKANILISTTATLKVIIFGVLVPKLDTNQYLVIPTILLLGVSLATMIYAILATRPIVTSGMFTREDIEKKRANLLFFGNFNKMPLEDFEWGMNEMMNDKDYLYSSMVKDLYYLGKVLGVKYRYLRIAYTIFMYGLIASVIAFVIALLNAPPHALKL